MTDLEFNQMQKEFLLAKQELGTETFNNHFRNVFGTPCLDFVKSIVINLPEPCYANCEYCIDSYLRKNLIDNESFLAICEKVLQEFPNAKSVAITGGTMCSKDFNELLRLIKSYLPDCYINWNTNGAGVNEEYLDGISKINHINLHRNSINEEENKRIFKSTKPLLSIEEAKKLMGDKLCIRVTIDETFDLNDYASLGVPLYLNRLLPGTKETDRIYLNTLKKLNISDDIDQRRRNIYLTADYQDIPVRICVGDKLSTHVPNRRPTYLNVAIIHRSGIVCGSWFEDDKVIYKPNEQLDNLVETDTNTIRKLQLSK